MTTWSIKFRGQEVQNPVLRVLLGFVLGIAAVVMVLVWIVIVALLVIFSPVLVLLHLILRASGRNGFVYRTPGKVSYKIGTDGFRKADYRY